MDETIETKANRLARRTAYAMLFIGLIVTVTNGDNFAIGALLAALYAALCYHVASFFFDLFLSLQFRKMVSTHYATPAAAEAVPEAELEPKPLDGDDDRPIWQQKIENAARPQGIYIDGCFFMFRESDMHQFLMQVAEARYDGHLLNVSERRLHDVGISRWTTPGAKQVVEFLREIGMISAAGEWSEIADDYFAPPPNTPDY